MRLRPVLLACAIALLTGCATVKGWFGLDERDPGDPAELTDIEESLRVRQLWSQDVAGEGEAWLRARPAYDGSRLYSLDDAGFVHAIDPATGRTLWRVRALDAAEVPSRWRFWQRRSVETGLTGGPGVGGGLVVVGGRGGEVVALDSETGAKRWSVRVTSEVLSAPAIFEDRVIVRSADGRTFGLDIADGSRRWVFERTLPSLSVRGNGSPAVLGGLVFVGYEDGMLVALRAADGASAWEQRVAEPDGRSDLDRMADIDGEIQLAADGVYAASYHDQVMAMAPENGRPLWNREIGSTGGVTLLPDRLLVSGRDGTVWALDRSTGAALWKQEALANRGLTTPVPQGDYVVVADFEGYLHWLSLQDGRIVARDRVQRSSIRGTPVLGIDGTLFVLTTEGELSAYRIGE
jgi:outer membrane protein assembly factor BamB